MEIKDLYGRLLVLAQSSREIDQKHAIGNFEFTLIPRALFTPDGALLPCTDKSKLIPLLEKTAGASYCPADPASDSYGHWRLLEDIGDDVSDQCKKIAMYNNPGTALTPIIIENKNIYLRSSVGCCRGCV
jgi:hypothetical protein